MAGTLVLKIKLIAVALTTLTLCFYGLRFALVPSEAPIWQRLISGFLGGCSCLVGLVNLWMSSMRASYGHTLLSAYFQVLMIGTIGLVGVKHMKKLTAIWSDPRKAQEEYLNEILTANSDTVYAKDFGLQGVTSLRELREKHQLTGYERYRPYADRMAKGEQGVLTRDPPSRFALTSGTTGRAKMLPVIDEMIDRNNKSIMTLLLHVRYNEFPKGIMLQKEASLYTAPKLRRTEAGIPMGPLSVIAPKMKKFLIMFPTPAVGFDIGNSYDSMYVHMLFALRDPNLYCFTTTFTSNFLSAMRQVERCWPVIVRDIKEGTVSTTNVPPEIHRTLVKAMGGGDRKRAAELRREFEKGFDGIMKRVWPHLQFAQSIDSVGLKEVLANSYVRGVPLHGQILGATEGIFGMNLWPRAIGKDEFVLLPHLCVFEFIAEDKIMEDQPNTLFIDELQVGGVYEIVITQLCGLYRYRLGDVIRVTRFHYETPVVQFMYRVGQILNVNSEKLDQKTVQGSIEAAVGRWPDVTLRDYAVAESTLLGQSEELGQDHRPFYLIFIELDDQPETLAQNKELLDMVDEELCLQSFTYNSYREKGSIAPPLVHVVQSGTFERLHDFILENSTTTANQYKVPRKLRTEATLKLMLDSSIVKSQINN